MPGTPLAASLFQLSILTRREYVADSNAAEFNVEAGNRRSLLLIGSERSSLIKLSLKQVKFYRQFIELVSQLVTTLPLGILN